MLLPWIASKRPVTPCGGRYWNRNGITWEAYLRWETRSFRARHEPRFSFPSWRKGIKLLSPISTQLHKWVITRECIIGKPTEGYRCRTQGNLTYPQDRFFGKDSKRPIINIKLGSSRSEYHILDCYRNDTQILSRRIVAIVHTIIM